jgi:segregation and condensation protein B
MDNLGLTIEALIFSSQTPLSVKDIKQILEECYEVKYEISDLEGAITSIIEKYETSNFAIEIAEISDGFTFMSKPIHHYAVSIMLKQNEKRKLSTAALETLSIIAYKQPVTKSEIEAIRGVNCDYAVQKLLERDLIEIVGRSDGPGRPLIFKTSQFFMNYFGLKSLKDLPLIKEIKEVENTIGEKEVNY